MIRRLETECQFILSYVFVPLSSAPQFYAAVSRRSLCRSISDANYEYDVSKCRYNTTSAGSRILVHVGLRAKVIVYHDFPHNAVVSFASLTKSESLTL
jgi:hypothetical protein